MAGLELLDMCCECMLMSTNSTDRSRADMELRVSVSLLWVDNGSTSNLQGRAWSTAAQALCASLEHRLNNNFSAMIQTGLLSTAFI